MKPKIILPLIIASVFHFYGYGQTLTGSFEHQLEHETRRLTLSKIGFKDQYLGGEGTNTYGLGRYKLKNNKLFLTYLDVPNQDTSAYTIDIQRGKTNITKLMILTYDPLGKLTSTSINLLDKNLKRTSTSFTNKFGQATIIIPDTSRAKFILIGLPISSVCPAKVPLPRLKNKSSKIEVKLKQLGPQYIRPHKVIYEVKKRTVGELLLYSEDGKEILFKKIK